MDLNQTIREFREEHARLSAAIAQLESLNHFSEAAPRSRRGRKSMAEAERREVSERMKRYWASRRLAKVGATAAGH